RPIRDKTRPARRNRPWAHSKDRANALKALDSAHREPEAQNQSDPGQRLCQIPSFPFLLHPIAEVKSLRYLLPRMLTSTTQHLRCPPAHCQGELELTSGAALPTSSNQVSEVRSGHLICRKCKMGFPIIAGVAVLIEDAAHYLASHVKGIAQIADD